LADSVDIICGFAVRSGGCAICSIANINAKAYEDFMSGPQDHNQAHDEESHEGPIKTPKQLALAVLFAFVVPIIVIVMLASYVTTESKPSAGSEALEAQATAARVQPVGRIEVKDLSDPASMKTGQQVFEAQCTACHMAGVLGAPKLGDLAAWVARNKTGYETLLNSALKGKNAMAAQGGGDFSDFEIGRAVVYMANSSGAKFDEPKAPAVAAK
jgi:cytochrome c5